MMPPLAVQKLIHNPYVYSGVAIARVTVCVATFLWALVMLAHPIMLSEFVGGAMGKVPVGQPLQFILGLGALFLASYQMVCTVKWCPQTLLTEAVSLSMVILWTLATIGAWADEGHASGAACTTAIMLLSWWNMATPPKKL